MGPEVLVVFVLGMMAPMALVALATFWWMTAEARGHVETLWERYARTRGLTFVPAVGTWPNRTAPGVCWAEGETSYRIEAAGDEAIVCTRVVGRAAVAVCGTFALRPGSAPRGLELGDPLIDGSFVVEARPSQLAPMLLTAGVKRALLGFGVGSRGSLTYDRGDVLLSWSGGEESEYRLDEAREVVRRVVSALEAQSGLP